MIVPVVDISSNKSSYRIEELAVTSTPAAGPLRIAVVGCGAIAPRHAEAYADTGLTELVGVVDVDLQRARQFGDRYRCRNVYSTVEDLLQKQSPDLVSITTPPGTHAQLAVAVLEAGSTVLLEKPPCVTLADMDMIAEAEARSSGAAYVVFQHRHGSAARRAKRLLSTGALGSPQVSVCETLWYRPVSYFAPDWRGTWRGEGGGPTLGHGIHQFDLLLHLLGPWTTIDALAARVDRPIEFEDVSMAMVRFDNGSVGSVINSLLSPQELSRIRIDTSGGTLQVAHVYGYKDADWSWTALPDPESGANLGRDPGVQKDGAEPAPVGANENPWTASAGPELPSNHFAQISLLVDDLLAGRPHETTLASTRPTMEFVTALYQSALLGSSVRRSDLTPGNPFYTDLSGGLSAESIAKTMLVE